MHERVTGPRDMAGAGGIWQRERDMAARAGYGGTDGIYSFRPFGEPPSKREARGGGQP